jgi:hypothetical protein
MKKGSALSSQVIDSAWLYTQKGRSKLESGGVWSALGVGVKISWVQMSVALGSLGQPVNEDGCRRIIIGGAALAGTSASPRPSGSERLIRFRDRRVTVSNRRWPVKLPRKDLGPAGAIPVDDGLAATQLRPRAQVVLRSTGF